MFAAITTDRKRLLQATLKLIEPEMSMTQFAASIGYNEGYLRAVLAGRQRSHAVIEAVDAFIAQYGPRPQAA